MSRRYVKDAGACHNLDSSNLREPVISVSDITIMIPDWKDHDQAVHSAFTYNKYFPMKSRTFDDIPVTTSNRNPNPDPNPVTMYP